MNAFETRAKRSNRSPGGRGFLRAYTAIYSPDDVGGQSRRFLEPPILPRWAYFHKGFRHTESRGVFSSRLFSHGGPTRTWGFGIRRMAAFSRAANFPTVNRCMAGLFAVEEARESRGRWRKPGRAATWPPRCEFGISDTADSKLRRVRSVRRVRRHVALILRGHTHADPYGADASSAEDLAGRDQDRAMPTLVANRLLRLPFEAFGLRSCARKPFETPSKKIDERVRNTVQKEAKAASGLSAIDRGRITILRKRRDCPDPVMGRTERFPPGLERKIT